ncbi:MAG TPA: hypothetical protein VN702_21295 [Acetobacteraceae bacterium]|nr:hypothetical protein [Acetobacteraceae bacterium]
MRDDISLVWPASGTMQVILLPGGGCTVKFIFADRGIVRSVSKGQIVKVRNIPTKRIAQHYEIIVRHDDAFESSYGIVDQTPHLPVGGTGRIGTPGTFVEDGDELYDIRNGGILHFQLYRAGRLVDPRTHIRAVFDGTIEASRPSVEQ